MVDKGPETSDTLSPSPSRGSSIPSSPEHVVRHAAVPLKNRELSEKPSPYIPLVRFTPSNSPWRKDKTINSSPIRRPPLSIVSSQKAVKSQSESETRLMGLLRSKSKVGNFHNIKLGKREMPQLSRSRTVVPEFISTNKSLKVRSESFDKNISSLTDTPRHEANRTFISNVKQLLQNDRALEAKAAALNRDSTKKPIKTLQQIKPASREKQMANSQVQNGEPTIGLVTDKAREVSPIVSQPPVRELSAQTGQEKTNQEAKTMSLNKNLERVSQKGELCIPNKRSHESAITEGASKEKKAKLLESSGDAKTVSDIVSPPQRIAAELLHGSTLERNNSPDDATKAIPLIQQRSTEKSEPSISKDYSDKAVSAQVQSSREKIESSKETSRRENEVPNVSDHLTAVKNTIQADDRSKKLKLDGARDVVRVLEEPNIASKASTITTTQLTSVKEKITSNAELSKDKKKELMHNDQLIAVKSFSQAEKKGRKMSIEGAGKAISVTAPEGRSTEKSEFSGSNKRTNNYGISRVFKKNMAVSSIEPGAASSREVMMIRNPLIDHDQHPKTINVVRQGKKTKLEPKVQKTIKHREKRQMSTQFSLEQIKAISIRDSDITSSKDEVVVSTPPVRDQTLMVPIPIYKGKQAIIDSDIPNPSIGRGQQPVMNKSATNITRTKSATVLDNIPSKDGPTVQHPSVASIQHLIANTSEERKDKSNSEPATSLYRDQTSVQKSILHENLVADQQVQGSPIKQIGTDTVNGFATAPPIPGVRARWNNALTEEPTDDESKRQNLVDLLTVLYREKTQIEEPFHSPEATGGYMNAKIQDAFVARILSMPEVFGDEEPDGKRSAKTRDKQHVLTEAVVSAGGDSLMPRQEEPLAREDSSLKLELHYLTEPDSTSSNDEESGKDNYNKKPNNTKEIKTSGENIVIDPKQGVIPVASRDKSAGKEISPKQDPVIERRKINRQLTQDVMKLNKKVGYAKDRISQLIEGGIAIHSSIASNPKVSVTNNICSAKNYEHSHAYYYQQMHKKGDLEYIPISGPLSANFVRNNELPTQASREAQPKGKVLESHSRPSNPLSSQIDKQDSTAHLREGWKRRWLATLQGCLVYIETPSASSEDFTAEKFLHMKKAFVGLGAKVVDNFDEKVGILITTKDPEAGAAEEKASNGGFRVWSVKKAFQFLINLGEHQTKQEVKPDAKTSGSVVVADDDTSLIKVPITNDKFEIKSTSTLIEPNRPSSTPDLVAPKPAKAEEIVNALERSMSPTTQKLTKPEPRVPESDPVAQEALHTGASECTVAPKLSSFGTPALLDSATISSHETWGEVSSDDLSEKEDIGEDQFIRTIIEDATNALEEKDKQIEAARKLILALSREVMQKELSITSLSGRLRAAEHEIKEQKLTLDDYAVTLAEKELDIMRMTDELQEESD